MFRLAIYFSLSARCNPIRVLVTTFNNSYNLLELSFHAYKMNPDPNPNPNPNLNGDNPNSLLDTIILLGYHARIECAGCIKKKGNRTLQCSSAFIIQSTEIILSQVERPGF